MNTLKFINGVYYANGKLYKNFYSALKFIDKENKRKKGEEKK